MLKLDRKTIAKYLKQGNKLGWCNYDAKEEMKKSGAKIGIMRGKRAIQLSLNGDYIDEFKSACEAARVLRVAVGERNISFACRNGNRTAYGYRWVYMDEWILGAELRRSES